MCSRQGVRRYLFPATQLEKYRTGVCPSPSPSLSPIGGGRYTPLRPAQQAPNPFLPSPFLWAFPSPPPPLFFCFDVSPFPVEEGSPRNSCDVVGRGRLRCYIGSRSRGEGIGAIIRIRLGVVIANFLPGPIYE